MKLCPLLESIQMPYRQRLEPPASFYDGLVAANNALPLDAIELAIDEMQYSADATLSELRKKQLMGVIEQLKALLPKGEG
jgi:hypothetical protein